MEPPAQPIMTLPPHHLGLQQSRTQPFFFLFTTYVCGYLVTLVSLNLFQLISVYSLSLNQPKSAEISHKLNQPNIVANWNVFNLVLSGGAGWYFQDCELETDCSQLREAIIS